MIFNEIAEYEDNDSQLAKDTILRLSNEINDLKEDNENIKYTIKQLLIANKDICDRNRKAIEYIKEHQRKDEFLNLNEWQTRDLLNIIEGDNKR